MKEWAATLAILLGEEAENVVTEATDGTPWHGISFPEFVMNSIGFANSGLRYSLFHDTHADELAKYDMELVQTAWYTMRIFGVGEPSLSQVTRLCDDAVLFRERNGAIVR